MRLLGSLLGVLAATLVAAGAGYTLLARSGKFQLSRDELVAAYADPASKFVKVKGIEIHYKDEGQGPPVVLFHGSFGSLHSWDGVVERLKNDHRLIRLDQAGVALSSDVPPALEGLSLEDYVAAFFDAIGLDRAAVVGTSSGGIIAYRFAAKYPERVTKMVISNAPSAVVDNTAIESNPKLDALIWLNDVLKHQPKIYWRAFLESLYGNPSRVTDAAVQRYYDIGRRVRPPPVQSMRSRVNDTAEIDGVLARVTTPTLLIWGVPDRVLPEAMGRQLQRKLSAAKPELIILNGTGHYPPVESPDAVAKLTRQFLQSTQEPPAQSKE